jgi:hypothetical protein
MSGTRAIKRINVYRSLIQILVTFSKIESLILRDLHASGVGILSIISKINAVFIPILPCELQIFIVERP